MCGGFFRLHFGHGKFIVNNSSVSENKKRTNVEEWKSGKKKKERKKEAQGTYDGEDRERGTIMEARKESKRVSMREISVHIWKG